MADDLLILISSPPNNPKALSALRLTQALRGEGRSVSLCLLQDGVLLALARQAAERIPALTSEIKVYALGEDLKMRGFGSQEVLPPGSPHRLRATGRSHGGSPCDGGLLRILR